MHGRLNIWLLILAVVCALSLWFGKDLMEAGWGRSPEAAVPTRTAADYSLSAEEAPVHLVVLNGTGEAGLAREVGLLLGRVGCLAESVGNAPHRGIGKSLLINRRLSDRRAGALARSLGGVRLIREWDDRGSEDAVLVLGADCSRVISSLALEKTAGGH